MRITMNEIENQYVELLPARETLTFGNSNWAAIYATNSSMALNAASVYSVAHSAAVQTIEVEQG